MQHNAPLQLLRQTLQTISLLAYSHEYDVMPTSSNTEPAEMQEVSPWR
jgi:hypothetical protein